ncbi:hypothetical protein [Streptomyces anulatus]|uniref:hypothetical protein n=1 Tax=Streptomyces anulatus TaxID=1892 RepID=UPI003987FADB
MAAWRNRTGLAEAVDHGRPFQVLHAERFAHALALARSITDPELRALPLSGSVDQWADSTDLVGRQGAVRAAVDASAADGPAPPAGGQLRRIIRRMPMTAAPTIPANVGTNQSW